MIDGPVVLEIETEAGETLRQELSIMQVPQSETEDQRSSIARFAAAMRLKELDATAGQSTALLYRLISAWTNWLVVADRPEESKSQGIPALRRVTQTMAAGATFSRMRMATPMRSGAMPAAKIMRGMPVFSMDAVETSIDRVPMPIALAPQSCENAYSASNLSRAGELLNAVTAQEWQEIAQWASQQGFSDLAQESTEFGNLVLTQMPDSFTEAKFRRGVEILQKARRLGFKLSHRILVESRRLGVNLDEAIAV
jgi:hypothetical protein